jgi:hypothetical protein
MIRLLRPWSRLPFLSQVCAASSAKPSLPTVFPFPRQRPTIRPDCPKNKERTVDAFLEWLDTPIKMTTGEVRVQQLIYLIQFVALAVYIVGLRKRVSKLEDQVNRPR